MKLLDDLSLGLHLIDDSLQVTAVALQSYICPTRWKLLLFSELVNSM